MASNKAAHLFCYCGKHATVTLSLHVDHVGLPFFPVQLKFFDRRFLAVTLTTGPLQPGSIQPVGKSHLAGFFHMDGPRQERRQTDKGNLQAPMGFTVHRLPLLWKLLHRALAAFPGKKEATCTSRRQDQLQDNLD